MINIKKITSILLINILFVSGCSSAFTVNKLAKNLNNYCIEAEYFDNTKTIEAKQTLTYTNKTGTTLNELKFNLYPKAFKEGASNKPVGSLTQQKAYPNGKDYGDIDIMSVTTSNKDQEYSYEEIDNNILNVKLNKPLKKGKIVMNKFHSCQSLYVNDEHFVLPFKGLGFVHQIESFIKTINKDLLEDPVMTYDESRDVMKIMDMARNEIGLKYPFE